MIPEFLDNGYLPEGIYEASFEEVKEKFGFSKKRKMLLVKMAGLIMACKLAGCNIFYLDGSFTGNIKSEPRDYDACWDTTNENRKSVLNNVFQSQLCSDSETQKYIFGGEIYPAFDKAPMAKELTILDYFQQVRNETFKKGIIKIML